MSASKKTFNKVLVVALHLCGWALLFTFPFRFFNRFPNFLHEPEPGFGPINGGMIDPSLYQVESVVTNTLLAAFFYLNMYVLIPHILSKKGWVLYISSVILALILYLLGGYAFRLSIFPGDGFSPPFFVALPNFFMILGISLALRLMQDRTDLEKNLKEQETERLKSELSFLRSQVSPHFIFNVLNSVASLARKKSDKVEDAIIQLSQLMRYTLYNPDQKVTIEKEVEYISSYINLQKLRFGNTSNVRFTVNMQRKDLLVEPMLLIPFVENAFKHGIGLIKEPEIMIALDVTEHQINFSVRNKFNPQQNEIKDTSSGIGLQNVKRRLDLLYKDLHSLSIEKSSDNWFIVELKLIAA